MNAALLMIDIQNDYFKGGKFELSRPEEAAGNAKKVLSYFREKSLPVFHIKHVNSQPSVSFFLPDTYGVEIYSEVAPIDGEEIVIKHTPDSFFNTNLQVLLQAKSINNLVICGMMSHMCVDTTVRSGKMKGYDIVLIDDACTTRGLKWSNVSIPAIDVHNCFMSSLNGIFADVMPSNKYISSDLDNC